MARVFKRKDRLSAMSEINLTSLMDLVFCLLIIFMVATPLLEQSIQVNLPQEAQTVSSPRDPKLKFQLVSINQQGQCFFGKDPVSLPELASRLNALAAQPDPPAIDFRGDRTLPYGKAVDVLDVIKKSGLNQLSLDTQVK